MEKNRVCDTLSDCHVWQYIRLRQTCNKPSLNTAFRVGRFASSSSFYNRSLVAHYGCVNALEFSNHNQELLATAGDDKRVLLWNVGEALINPMYKPGCMKGTHVSNVFCLGFDTQNKMLLSSGNDEQVLVHDIATGQLVNMILRDDAVYALSTHPMDVNIFATASEDGKVHIMDMRKSNNGSGMCLVNYIPAFHGVSFNPYAPLFVAASHSKEGVGLWDIRKPKSVLLKYSPHEQDSTMSVRFNEDGSQLFVLRRRAGPVLYNTSHANPVATFEQSGYFNSCTMKSGCFAGENDEYVVSGSDDFNVYIWRTPEKTHQNFHQTVKPAKLILKGHKSIVNQVRYSKQAQSVVSSGVEKAIKLWSPFQYPGSRDFQQQAQASRPLYTRNEYIDLVLRSGTSLTHNYDNECTSEDPRMIAFFDSLIQHDANQSSDESDDDLLGLSVIGSNSSQASLDNIVRELHGSSSSEDETEVESSVVSYLLRRMGQPSHTAEETVNFARLRALRAALAEEESTQEFIPGGSESPESRSQSPSAEETMSFVQNDSGLGTNQPSSHIPSTKNITAEGGQSTSSLKTHSSDSGCENEVKIAKTRQKNANRKRKASKWVVKDNEGEQTNHDDVSKAHCSRPNDSCEATCSINAYDRSLEKLNRSIDNTNQRFAKVAENLAQALNTSDEEENTTNEKG